MFLALGKGTDRWLAVDGYFQGGLGNIDAHKTFCRHDHSIQYNQREARASEYGLWVQATVRAFMVGGTQGSKLRDGLRGPDDRDLLCPFALIIPYSSKVGHDDLAARRSIRPNDKRPVVPLSDHTNDIIIDRADRR